MPFVPRIRHQKKKDKAEHEDAADALDVALKTFTENAEKLDGLIVQKRAEMEEAEQGKYAPEKVEVYHEQMMQLYSLKAEDVTLESVETIPEGHTAVVPAEYQFLPVSCVVLVDVLYHPYFKDKLARQVAYISTTTHPNVAHFMGLCFKQNALQVQSAEPAAEAKGKKKKDKKPQEVSCTTVPCPSLPCTAPAPSCPLCPDLIFTTCAAPPSIALHCPHCIALYLHRGALPCTALPPSV